MDMRGAGAKAAEIFPLKYHRVFNYKVHFLDGVEWEMENGDQM